MRICPACGSDILDSATVRCSSCGTDLKASAPVSGGGRAMDESRRAAQADTRDQSLDDSHPINEESDLDIVKEGHAFWAEAQAQAEAKRRDETVREKATGGKRDEALPEKRSTMVFEGDEESGTGISLAELARRRRA